MDHVIDILKIAVSAFLGAWVAFKLQQYNLDQKKIEEQFAEGKKAQFILFTQFNALLNFKTQILDKHRNDSARAFVMPPFSIHSEYPELDINALSYILNEGKPSLLSEMLITEQKFRTLLGAIDQRNNYHKQLQQRLSESEHSNSEISSHEIESIVGIAICKSLGDLTDAVYKFSDDAIKSHLVVCKQLQHFLLQKFKDKKQVPLYLENIDEIEATLTNPEGEPSEENAQE